MEGKQKMKLGIRDYCIRCGICEDLYPQLFHVNLDEDVVEVRYDPVPEELEETARSAMKDCAIAAIYVIKE